MNYSEVDARVSRTAKYSDCFQVCGTSTTVLLAMNGFVCVRLEVSDSDEMAAIFLYWWSTVVASILQLHQQRSLIRL
jgi:hypothetical protein